VGIVYGPRYGPRFSLVYGPGDVIDKSGVKAAAPAFPTTLLAMATAAGGYGSWDAQFRFQELAGNCLNDSGGFSLVPANSPVQGVTGAIAGDLAIQMTPDGATDRAVSASNADLDHTVDSWALFCTFKIDAVAAANRYFAGKIGGAGWWGLQINASGHVLAPMNDGATSFTSILSVDHRDGNWHDALLVVDRAANTMQVFTDLGSGSAINIAAAGSFTNTGNFGVGRHASVTGAISVTHLAHSTDVTNMLANAPAIITAFRSYTGR
jgi:hypothetical protein